MDAGNGEGKVRARGQWLDASSYKTFKPRSYIFSLKEKRRPQSRLDRCVALTVTGETDANASSVGHQLAVSFHLVPPSNLEAALGD